MFCKLDFDKKSKWIIENIKVYYWFTQGPLAFAMCPTASILIDFPRKVDSRLSFTFLKYPR